MAAQKKAICTIDNLPEARRREIVDALLAGASLRSVAKMVGCSPNSVADYRKRIILPAVEKAQQVQRIQPLAPGTSSFQHAESQTNLTRDIIRTTPFRERLEALWNRTNEALDASGPTSSNFDLHPSLLNQAHKNLEMLGRVTGELADNKSTSVAIQIVVPHAKESSQTLPDPTIDIALPVRK